MTAWILKQSLRRSKAFWLLCGCTFAVCHVAWAHGDKKRGKKGRSGLAAGEGKVTTVRTPNGGIQPQAALDQSGTVHLIYFKGSPKAGDVYYVRSTDGGATFSRPVRVNSEGGSAVAMGTIRGAHLALGKGGRAHVSWMSAKKSAQSGERPMLYARLNDAGTAFEAQRNVIAAAYGLDGGGSIAADGRGNVYVVWHAPAAGSKGEMNRTVWVARSRDDGKTFAREVRADPQSLGACGCCGMRAFADARGSLYILYRTARAGVNRDMRLLSLRNGSRRFQGRTVHKWPISRCVMSSASFIDGSGRVLLGWETKKQVYFAAMNAKTGRLSPPAAAPGMGKNRKMPALAMNKVGDWLLAWTEGTAWNRGGSVAWQVYDKSGKPRGPTGRADGLPKWSLVAAFARPDGSFVVVY